jgi:hypothetical protein
MPTSPGVQSLKAGFEAKAAHLANMAIPNLKQLNDLNITEPIHQPSPAPRPAATSGTAPSWIGPVPQGRNNPFGSSAMKLPVSVEFTSPGLQPPVYICSSLTDPKWGIIEMDPARNEHGEYHFSKSFSVEEGEYQYKIRLGPGDWWAIDNTKPTVDDGTGNKNNLIVVKHESIKPVDASVLISSLNVMKSQPVVPVQVDSTPMLAPKHEEANAEPAAKPHVSGPEPAISTVLDTKLPEHINDLASKPHAPAAEPSIVPVPSIVSVVPTMLDMKSSEHASIPATQPHAAVAEPSTVLVMSTGSDTKPPVHINDPLMQPHVPAAEPSIVPERSTMPNTRLPEHANDPAVQPIAPAAEHPIVPVVSAVSDTKSPEHANDPVIQPHDPAPEHAIAPEISAIPDSRPPEHSINEFECPPLLPHETVVPSSLEQRQAPLFRHENTAIDNMQHELSHVENVLLSTAEQVVPHGPVVIGETKPDNLPLQKSPTDATGTRQELASEPRRVPPDTTSSSESTAKPSTDPNNDDQLRIISEADGDDSQTQDISSNKFYGTFEQAVISQGQMTPPLTPKGGNRNGVAYGVTGDAHAQAGGPKTGSVHASLISIAYVMNFLNEEFY